MAEYDNSNKLSGWIHDGVNGKFISGIVNIQGKDYEFTLNKNDKGDNPKRPDYVGRIKVEEATSGAVPSSADEDVPF